MASAGERLEGLAIRIRDMSPSDGPAPRSLLLREQRGRPSTQLSLGAYRDTHTGH